MRVQRRRVADEVSRDGETAILVDGQVVRLSEVSTAIWKLTIEPAELDVVAAELESRFGVPEGATSLEATKDAVSTLVHHGVLRAVD